MKMHMFLYLCLFLSVRIIHGAAEVMQGMSLHSPSFKNEANSREPKHGFLQTKSCMVQEQEGLCYGELTCDRLRGKVSGYCSGFQGACCIFYRSCYGKTSQEISHFRNEKWPAEDNLQETCSFSIVKKDQSYCGLRIRLVKLSLPGYVGRCTHTFFWISGIPRRNFDFICGDFNGQYYDFNITSSTEIFLKMKSYTRFSSSWSMVVSQIKCNDFFHETLPKFGDGTEIAGGAFGQSTEAPLSTTSRIPTTITTSRIPTTTTTSRPSTTTTFVTSTTSSTTTSRPTTPSQTESSRPLPIAEDYEICGIKGIDDSNIVINFKPIVNRLRTQNFDANIEDNFSEQIGWTVPELKDSIFYKNKGSQSFFGQRITHGQLAGQEEFPWQIAIFIGKSFHCGGSIVSERYILTAAHCVTGFTKRVNSVRVVVGKWDISHSNDRSFDDYEVDTIIANKKFSRYTLQNDIALMKLKKKIKFNLSARPICLPITPLEPDDELAYVTGWGRDLKGQLVSKLHKLKSAIVNNTWCNIRWTKDKISRELIAPSMVCMDAQNGDSCNGDSGGPSVLERPPGSGQYIQVGIVSFGSGSCTDKNLPGVYTRVSYFLQWIQSNMN